MTPSCPLCFGRGSLEHLLCPKGNWDFRWRQDQVLKAGNETIATAISTSRHHDAPKSITFVKAGERPCPQQKPRTGLLYMASNWQLNVNLAQQLKFPLHIIATSLQTDIIIITSEMTKTTDHAWPHSALERAHWRSKLEEMQSTRDWWKSARRTKAGRHTTSPEVGCRGFAGCSLCKVLNRLGMTGEAKKRAIQSAGKAQRKPPGRCGWWLIRGWLLLGRKSWPDQPLLGRLGASVWCWTPEDSRSHHR